jgi:hypothetical protein
MSEYNNTTVNGSSCSYANLSNYNNGNQGMMRPPIPATTVVGQYIVPNYSSPGYNTLSHDSAPSCAGYFNIQSAYGGNGSQGCGTQYVSSLCQ